MVSDCHFEIFWVHLRSNVYPYLVCAFMHVDNARKPWIKNLLQVYTIIIQITGIQITFWVNHLHWNLNWYAGSSLMTFWLEAGHSFRVSYCYSGMYFLSLPGIHEGNTSKYLQVSSKQLSNESGKWWTKEHHLHGTWVETFFSQIALLQNHSVNKSWGKVSVHVFFVQAMRGDVASMST